MWCAPQSPLTRPSCTTFLSQPNLLAPYPILQVTAYNRDSFNTTQQMLVLLIGDPEGTTALSHPYPTMPVLGESPLEGVVEATSGGQDTLKTPELCSWLLC